MEKLNFGCGTRYAPRWTNIDFHGDGTHVKRVNLLAGFPFSNSSFDLVYSSHVLEHFTPQQGAFLIRESCRVLKAGGTLRTVVPDLEASCQEYLRILALSDSDPEKTTFYNWIKIELLDQLVRTSSGGEMGPLMGSVANRGDRKMIEYVQSRIESDLGSSPLPEGVMSRLARVTPGKVLTKLTYLYLALVKRLVPKNLQPMVWSGTSIGEKHRWMYDRYGLTLLMNDCGFAGTRFVSFNESCIPGFCEDRLDSNPDGKPYKNVSIYCEATKL
jgi:SAM-dependent methyltransferase